MLILRPPLIARVSGAALFLAGTALASDPEGTANLAGKRSCRQAMVSPRNSPAMPA